MVSAQPTLLLLLSPLGRISVPQNDLLMGEITKGRLESLLVDEVFFVDCNMIEM